MISMLVSELWKELTSLQRWIKFRFLALHHFCWLSVWSNQLKSAWMWHPQLLTTFNFSYKPSFPVRITRSLIPGSCLAQIQTPSVLHRDEKQDLYSFSASFSSIHWWAVIQWGMRSLCQTECPAVLLLFGLIKVCFLDCFYLLQSSSFEPCWVHSSDGECREEHFCLIINLCLTRRATEL